MYRSPQKSQDDHENRGPINGQNAQILANVGHSSSYNGNQRANNQPHQGLQKLETVPKQAESSQNVTYAQQLAQEYIRSRLNWEDTSESVSLVQACSPPEVLINKGYELVTNQSIHVRCAYYISYVQKVMFYRQLEQQLAARGQK